MLGGVSESAATVASGSAAVKSRENSMAVINRIGRMTRIKRIWDIESKPNAPRGCGWEAGNLSGRRALDKKRERCWV